MVEVDGGQVLEEDRLLTALVADTSIIPVSKLRGSFGCRAPRRGRLRCQLATRLLTKWPGLLEDESHGLTSLVLGNLHTWNFSAFLLDRCSGGRSLSTLCLHIFHTSGLIASFGLDPVDCYSFFRLVEHGYHPSNPYHTSLHAADVTQAISVFCSQEKLKRHLTKLELLAALTAAVCHDLDHPGVNEKFLVSTGSHLAVLYDNVSVLENHHWRSAISCFVESGLTRYLNEAQYLEFTDLVRALVLATDISRQQEFLNQLRHHLDTGDCDPSRQDTRHFLLKISIKCADISNPCRPWPISRLWSLRACEEFFRQGDRERELGIHPTPICDRYNITVAKVQVGFYRFVAEPLFKEWHRFLNSPLSQKMLTNLYANQAGWEEEVVQQQTPAPKPVVVEQPVVITSASPHQQQQQPTSTPQPSLARRLSLPVSDPLHRIFDQMTQPDQELPRAAASHLRRNFSLTDKRRSSLLRGLHGRSLKPVRGRMARPASVCIVDNAEQTRAARPLQPRENRPEGMEVSPDESHLLINSSKPDLFQEKENTGGLHASYERLTKRRGSAPSNLVLEDCRPVLLRHQACLAASTRRGSLPSDLLTDSLPRQLRSRLLQTKIPDLLRRRSMGPELLAIVGHPIIKERPLVQKYLTRPF